jgi:hypothetical protein
MLFVLLVSNRNVTSGFRVTRTYATEPGAADNLFFLSAPWQFAKSRAHVPGILPHLPEPKQITKITVLLQLTSRYTYSIPVRDKVSPGVLYRG